MTGAAPADGLELEAGADAAAMTLALYDREAARFKIEAGLAA